jgi:hypothetical protein
MAIPGILLVLVLPRSLLEPPKKPGENPRDLPDADDVQGTSRP